MSATILPYKGVTPIIHPSAYLAPGVIVIGDVHIGRDTNVWPGCVIRGDVNHIRIGERTNIQDGTVIHVTRVTGPTIIGSGITIGHSVLLHACILEDGCFIGMHATVMDAAVVESGAMVGAGALVTPGKRIPAGEIWAGNPARFFRKMSEAESAYIPVSAQNYVDLAGDYRESVESRKPSKFTET